ncbi:hypothetical protein TNCV_2916961 [Trichonephila clavipes]|nr:hypothetical protein TNCV_2916961 [Trichonephila clavipes]
MSFSIRNCEIFVKVSGVSSENKKRNQSENSKWCSNEDFLMGSMSVFLCSSQYASTHHGAQQGKQPAGHLTCVRHGTYLRGGTGL